MDMAYLVFLLVLVLIFAGFLALTAYERARGRRLFAESRASFDARVARAEFVATHVDFAAFVRDTLKNGAERAAHDAAHAVLQAVRWSERQLTRAVRTLRARRAEMAAGAQNGAPQAAPGDAAPAQASEFARTIADFKQDLRAQRADAAPEADTSTEAAR
jgi:hypothetical protein